MIAGVSTQDLNQRIEMIAERVRALFFGASDVLEFECQKANGSRRIIILPDIDSKLCIYED
jgi:hypothetical protein